jgi:hypothetical protein
MGAYLFNLPCPRGLRNCRGLLRLLRNLRPGTCAIQRNDALGGDALGLPACVLRHTCNCLPRR